jgi:hypothetical protein
MDLRAHAHNERHRINSELHAVTTQVSAGFQPEDVHEPGRAWVPEHHRSADRAREHSEHQQPRHWKLKMWKRRTAQRQAKAEAFRLAGQ